MISERALLRTHRKICDLCGEAIEQSRNLVFRYYGLVPYSKDADVAADVMISWEIPTKDDKMTETEVIKLLKEVARNARKHRRKKRRG